MCHHAFALLGKPAQHAGPTNFFVKCQGVKSYLTALVARVATQGLM